LVLPTIDIPLDVSVDNVWIKELEFQPYGDAPAQTVKDIRLQAANNGREIALSQLSAVYQNFEAKVQGTITLEDNYPLDLQLTTAATDVFENYDANIELNASNTLENLTLEGQISGIADVKFNGEVQALDPKLPVDLSITAAEAGWPLDTFQLAKAQDVSLTIGGNIDDFQINLAADISGEQIPQSSVLLNAIANPSRVLVPDITVKTLDGFATGSAAATLGEQIAWVSELIIKDINPEGIAPEAKGLLNGVIRADGGVHQGKWMMNLKQAELNGEIKNIPFSADAVLSKSYDDQWRVQKLLLDNGQNRVDASGDYGEKLDFTANVNLTQLQNFVPGLAGGFTGNLSIQGQPMTPSMDIQLASDVLKYNDILIMGLRLNADVAEGALEPSSLDLNVAKVQSGRQLSQNIKLGLNGTRDEHTIKLFADGPQATAVDLTAAGGLTPDFDWLGELQNALLELPAHNVRLADSFELAWDNEIKKARIGAHCWRTEETRLCLENEVLAEPTGTANVSLTQYPLTRLDPFLPAGSELQGSLKADAVVQWGESYPGGYNATLEATIDNGGLKVVDDAFDELNFTYDTFTVDASANGNAIAANSTLRSNTLGNADINVTLDSTQEQRPIGGDISLQGFDIAFLKAFMPNFDEIGGEINTNGTLSGSVTDPRFNGLVVLNEPVVKAESLPVSIDGGRVDVRVDGKRARITGNLASGEGKVNVSGNADWTQLDAWRADIIVASDNLNVQADPLVRSSVDTDIRISLKPGDVRIRGDVSVPMAFIEVADVAQGATALSDDVIIIEDEIAESEGQAEAAASATNIDVKMNVSLGDDVRLEAFGLKAQVVGDMTVAVSPPRPLELGGEVRIVEGIFKQYGQDLKVTDGQVLFVGPIDNTRLDMDAVREIEAEERVAGLRVSGPLAEPQVTLFTDPADKSQDSILSYILLGRDINTASDQEQNLLATAALALTLNGGRGKATELAEAFGISEFTLDARGRGDDTEVVVSGRLNDKLLLRYGRSVFTPGSTLYLRYDITRQLYLEAADGVERAVDLFYSFSF
jgi:translocation and assembly module TamB